jgi:hypothetical protein
MNKRKRAGAIAASGAAIWASMASLAAGRHDSFAGLPGDFWMGCVVGIALGLAVLGVLAVARGRGIRRLS